MIEEQTVFILGAGASAPYRYPTGKDLRSDIYTHFSPRLKSIDWKSIGALEVEKWIMKADQLSRTFKKSSTQSIDLFLARNRDLADIGKLAIVLSIFGYERNSRFREDNNIRDQPDHDWYSYLFQRMTQSLTDPTSYKNFGNNKVTFVTFNYDRSLEHFLYESLRNSFLTAEENEIVEQLVKIPILHVYGKIASLPWENEAGTPYLSEDEEKGLSGNHGFGYFQNLTRNIRIIHERTDNNCSEMIEKISSAKRIFFLGFGYAKENLEILQLNSILTEGHKIFGTALGSLEKEIVDIRSTLGSGIPSWRPSYINPYIKDMDCVRLLREYL